MHFIKKRYFTLLNNISTTFLIALLFCSFLPGCSTGPEPIEAYGKQLKGVHIYVIVKANDKLVFATNNGVFMYKFKNNLFYKAGLQGKKITDIVQTGNGEFLAGVYNYDQTYQQGTNTLYKTTNGGQSWRIHMGNYGGEKEYNFVSELAVHPEDKSILFARGGAYVARSLNGGQTWESVNGSWDTIGASTQLLKIDPNNPNIIWAGGSNAFALPLMSKSVDGGNSWQFIEYFSSDNWHSEASVYAMAIHSLKSKKIMVGVGGVILKSTDGGRTFKIVQKKIAAKTFTHSAQDPGTIYASGININHTLFFAMTKNFGETWQRVEIKNTLGNIHVDDMVSVMQNGHEILYFGTNKGVFSYTVKK